MKETYFYIIRYVHQNDESGTRNPGFGFWLCRREMGTRQVEQGLPIFLKVLQRSSNMPKIWHIMKKTLSELAF